MILAEVGTNVATKSLLLPERGIMVELPPTCANGITFCPKTGIAAVDPMTRMQLKIISEDSILRRRYSSSDQGEKYMVEISPQWRERLMEKAKIMTGQIKGACSVADIRDYAIILYGSLAKNLVKGRTHQDPSNIDLAVIGDFDWAEKTTVLDLIRPLRQQITTEIKGCELCRKGGVICQCQGQDAELYWIQATAVLRNRYGELSESGLRRTVLLDRVNVTIQTPDVLRGSGYGEVRDYIASCARAVYDPYGLWEKLENEAIVYLLIPRLIRQRIREGKPVRSLDNVYALLRDSNRFRKDIGVVERVVNSLRQVP